VVAKEHQRRQQQEACGACRACPPQTLQLLLLGAKRQQKPALRFRDKRPARVRLEQRG
jgi:hypothetical protein